MFPELDYQWTHMKALWDRLRILREDDRGGVSVEMVLIIVGLILAAGVLVAAISARVGRESQTINPGG